MEHNIPPAMEQAMQQRSGHSTSSKAEPVSLSPPAVSKKTEFEHKWHSSHIGERWGVGRKGIGSMWISIFFQLAHSQTLTEGSKKQHAEKLLIFGCFFTAVFVTLLACHINTSQSPTGL